MHPYDDALAGDEPTSMSDDPFEGDDAEAIDDGEFSPPNWTADVIVSQQSPRAYVSGRFVRCVAAIANPRVVVLGGLLDPEEGAALCAMLDTAIQDDVSADDGMLDDESVNDLQSLASADAANEASAAPAGDGDGLTATGDPSGECSESQIEDDDFQAEAGSAFEMDDPVAALGQQVIQQLDERIEGVLSLFNVRTSGIGIYTVGPDGAESIAPPDAVEAQASGPAVGAVIVFLQAPSEGGAVTLDSAGLSVPPIVGQAVFVANADDNDASLQWSHDPIADSSMWMAVKWLFQSGEDAATDDPTMAEDDSDTEPTSVLEAQAPKLLQ